MNKIKKETYKKLMTFYKFKIEDYDAWGEMLNYLDTNAIDEALLEWIRTKSKAPTIAEIGELAKEIELKNRLDKKSDEKSQEEKMKARERLFQEGVKALEKNFYLVFEKIASGDTAYSWVHENMINNDKNLRSFDLKNPYTGETISAFYRQK